MKMGSGLEKMAAKRGQNKGWLNGSSEMPPGADSDIWHLTLLFIDLMEERGNSGGSVPINYLQLSNRINSSEIKSNFTFWPGVIEEMMEYFLDYELDPERAKYAMEDFCQLEMFNYLMQLVVDIRARAQLISEGIRRTLEDREKKPPRRTDEETVALKIISKQYTEEELEEKKREFIERRELTDNEGTSAR
jgi:hypothetical protein